MVHIKYIFSSQIVEKVEKTEAEARLMYVVRIELLQQLMDTADAL